MAPEFTLYTHPCVPNGIKMAIFLEELKKVYPDTMPEHKVYQLNILQLEHRSQWYMKFNPNGKVPVVVYHSPDGTDHAVFESAAILMSLTRRYDPEYKLTFPPMSDEEAHCMQWIFWGHGDLAPMAGMAVQSLSRLHAEEEYPIKRFIGETVKLYTELNTQLEGRDFLVGEGRGTFSIADILLYPWVVGHPWAGIESIEMLPNVERWKATMNSRPSVQAVQGMMAAASQEFGNPEQDWSDVEED